MDTLPNCYRCGNQPCECKDGIALYHADCRDVLPLLEPGSVDLVLTDPPYGIGYGAYMSHDDSPVGYDAIWNAIYVCESLSSGYCVVFQSGVTCDDWARRMNGRKWRIFSAPKVKTTPRPEGNIVPSCDFALYWSVGNIKPWRDNGIAAYRNWFVSSDTARVSGLRQKPSGHPCPRPLDLMAYLVNAFCKPGGTALDPFAGSGTTGRACKDLGRKCIMIEIEERYCEIAANRLRQNVLFT